MPASSAAWMVAMLSARSLAPYISDIPMQPRPMAGTLGPLWPSVRNIIDDPFFGCTVDSMRGYAQSLAEERQRIGVDLPMDCDAIHTSRIDANPRCVFR